MNSGDVALAEMPPPRFDVIRPPPTEMSLMASGMLAPGLMPMPGMMPESPHNSETSDLEVIQRKGGDKKGDDFLKGKLGGGKWKVGGK